MSKKDKLLNFNPEDIHFNDVKSFSTNIEYLNITNVATSPLDIVI